MNKKREQEEKISDEKNRRKNKEVERKEEKINGVNYVYYLTEKKDMVFCRDESV